MTKKILKVWITGATGMVGSSLEKILKKNKNTKILKPTRKILDLTDQKEVMKWVKKNKPDHVYMTAAVVGGIFANSNYPAEFIYKNLQIQNNVIEASRIAKIKKLVFLGSSCIYPRNSKQPIKEEYLMTGSLEKTNQWYAIAKISGIKMIQAYRKQYDCNFISLMPCNMYGPNDNYHKKNSHVFAALIKKFVTAKKENKKFVEIWGSGKPLREFLHVDDFSRAIILASKKYNKPEPLNVGSGREISIIDLAKLISKIVNYKGKIKFNRKYPDGTPRKILDITKIKKLGWKPKISLEEGIKLSVKEYKNLNN